jgi:hypothetical protein
MQIWVWSGGQGKTRQAQVEAKALLYIHPVFAVWQAIKDGDQAVGLGSV